LDLPDASFEAKAFSPAPHAGRKKVKEEAQHPYACGMALPVSGIPEEALLLFGKPPAPILNHKSGPMPKEMLMMRVIQSL
jgi:hypothetical protein